MSCDIGEVMKKVGESALLILQPSSSLQIHHSSFSNPSVALPISQLILQPFYRFTYITTHSPTLPSLYLRHNSFSNPSVVLPTSQLILQAFRHFTYVTAHSPTLPSLYLRHSSFSNPSVISPTSQLIVQLFRRFTYVTVHSPTLLSLLVRHRLFTYVTMPTLNVFLYNFQNIFIVLYNFSQKLSYTYLRMRYDVGGATEGLENDL